MEIYVTQDAKPVPTKIDFCGTGIAKNGNDRHNRFHVMHFYWLIKFRHFGLNFGFRPELRISALISASRNISDFGFGISDFGFWEKQFRGHS